MTRVLLSAPLCPYIRPSFRFTCWPEIWIVPPIVYRAQGFFPGRELYFLDPSGNMLELRDPTWKPGMPQPTYEEIIRS